jgi:sulfite exporter TauE/SafE
MNQFSLIAVFFVGLLGAVHCFGMCGSIVGALTQQLPKDRIRWPFHLAYSIGRIASYAMAGALVGSVGQAGMLFRDVAPIQHLLFGLSSVMLILLGLHLSGIWGVVQHIERIGAFVWKRIQPYTTRLLPVTTIPRALTLGALWGWLPCGLVYSILIVALSSASPGRGALVMLSFGLGTLPSLLALGFFWERCRSWIQAPRVRLLAGLIVVAFGAYGLFHVGSTLALNGWYGSCHVPVSN